MSQPAPVTKEDNMGTSLLRATQYAVVALFGFLAVFFTPGLWASLGFDKVFLAVGLAAVAVIIGSLLMLRRVRMQTVLPLSWMLFWGAVAAALVSGLLSGDRQDALRGSVMEPQTVAFLAVMAVLMTVPLFLQRSKIMSIKALVFFGITATLLLVYNLVRLLFGAAFLPFDSFGVVTVSPIGGFNDLAIFAALMVLIGLVTLGQLPLKKWLQLIVAGVIAISLVVLAAVNFFNIWIIVGFFGLLMLIYLLSRDTLFGSEETAFSSKSSQILVGTTAVVCIVSALFVSAGDYVGGKMNALTGANYVEVRPSVEATIDIARAVYSEDALLGIGPNRFTDAWRVHKDRSINETIFWDTDFNAGSGFVPTLFVNLGLLGSILLIASHLLFLFLGYKMLLRSTNQDPYWYYFGAASFTAATFLWVMSYIYVPGAAILLLTALFTGFTFVAAGSLLPNMVRTIPLAANRRSGFFMMATVIVIITVSVATLFSVGKQYMAEARFTKAQLTAETLPEFEQVALSSFGLYSDDRFISARAQIELANLNSLLAIAEPTQEDQQRFLETAQRAIAFAEEAVKEDPTNPDHHTVLAGVYSNLALAGIDGAQAKAEESLARAQALEPLNPGYRLIAAQIAARIGDLERARAEIASALELKRNFTDALYLSAQLDINEGNTEAAIATTRSIITLEPNNPTRYFQLGVLLSANNSLEEAARAYQAALSLDPQYANARYLLALTLLNLNQPALALDHLKLVQQTNVENQELANLIQQVEAGDFEIPVNPGFTAPVTETSPSEGVENPVTTDRDLDTDLVTPVNTISTSGEGSEEASLPDFEAANETETDPTE